MGKNKNYAFAILGGIFFVGVLFLTVDRITVQAIDTNIGSIGTASPTPPSCGSADGKEIYDKPTTPEEYCQSGVKMGLITNETGIKWQCYVSGLQPVNCSATILKQIETPSCGSANGNTLISAPVSSALCSKGNALGLHQTNDGWKWYCSSSGVVDDAVQCSAKLKIQEQTTVFQDNRNDLSEDDSIDFIVRLIPLQNGTIYINNFEVVIEAPEAERVELRSKREGSENFEYFSTARKASSGKWTVLVNNIERLPNGKHHFIARAWKGNVEKISNPISVEINIETIRSLSPRTPISSAPSAPSGTLDNYDYTQREDSDSDGLSDEMEKKLGTNPNLADTDKDGLPDGEEVRLGTDPKKPDTDRDGFLDGDEVKNGFDPLKYSKGDGSDRMAYEDPREKGEVNESYVVNNVELLHKETGDKRISLTGKGLPNSFVTLYIYSDPIIVTIKTDNDGNWIYEVDKEFDDGEHEAYVAVTDNTGKITGKSEPMRFIKTAEAATIIPNVRAQEVIKNQTPTQNSKTNFILFAFIAIVVFLGIALAVVGVISHRHSYD